jgi:pimeloyl-ACP methyl ester carboxylesterase
MSSRAAVDYIFKHRGVTKVNLIGWSWGTTTMATFAAENPEKVLRLVLSCQKVRTRCRWRRTACA